MLVYFTVFSFCAQYNQEAAISIGYFAGVAAHFLGNRYITFQDETSFWLQLPKYGTTVLINYLITLGVAYFLMDWSPYIVITASIGTTVVSGFLFTKNWVFKP